MSSKYDKIGKGYNSHRKADLHLASRMTALLSPQDDEAYLDIGCGTGNYTEVVFQKVSNVIGIDPSELMLQKAKDKMPGFTWKIGSAENTNLDNDSIDGILASLTIHHWKDLEKAFRELSRLLKPGGRIVVFTSSPEQMKGYWLNHYFPKMLDDSIQQMPDLNSVESAMEKSGLQIEVKEPYFVKDDLQDMFLYAGKQRPELYLDENVRQGISSFSNLANKQEVEAGLESLREDLDSGRINSVIKSYENNLGDYIFIKALVS